MTQAVILIDTFCDLFYSFFVVVYMIVSAVHNQHLFNHSDKYEQVRLAFTYSSNANPFVVLGVISPPFVLDV